MLPKFKLSFNAKVGAQIHSNRQEWIQKDCGAWTKQHSANHTSPFRSCDAEEVCKRTHNNSTSENTFALPVVTCCVTTCCINMRLRSKRQTLTHGLTPFCPSLLELSVCPATASSWLFWRDQLASLRMCKAPGDATGHDLVCYNWFLLIGWLIPANQCKSRPKVVLESLTWYQHWLSSQQSELCDVEILSVWQEIWRLCFKKNVDASLSAPNSVAY